MPTTDESSLAEVLPTGPKWSNGSDTGGAYGNKRIKRLEDTATASDINELRDAVEALIFHTHEYEDSATVVNSC